MQLSALNRTLLFFLFVLLATSNFLGCKGGMKENSDQSLTSYQSWFSSPYPAISAHRGGPYPGYPENALETFEQIASQMPTIIECDVAMTKDSVLVLMHDQNLDRTTTGSGLVSQTPYDSLKTLFLIDNSGDTTSYKIPLLQDVLEWGRGKVLYTLDIKRGVPFQKVIELIEQQNAEDYAAIITYSLEDAEWVHLNNDVIYLSISLRNQAAIEQFKKMDINAGRVMAFVGTSEPDAAHYQRLDSLSIPTILGTLGNLDRSAIARGDDSVYESYINRGADVIATDRPLEVAKVIYWK